MGPLHECKRRLPQHSSAPDPGSPPSLANRLLHHWSQQRERSTNSSLPIRQKGFEAEKQMFAKQQDANDRRAAELETAVRKQDQASLRPYRTELPSSSPVNGGRSPNRSLPVHVRWSKMSSRQSERLPLSRKNPFRIQIANSPVTAGRDGLLEKQHAARRQGTGARARSSKRGCGGTGGRTRKGVGRSSVRSRLEFVGSRQQDAQLLTQIDASNVRLSRVLSERRASQWRLCSNISCAFSSLST